MHWFFIFFTVSGFCSLVYQVAWLRVAMSAFGVTTPLVSIILSVFMAGLALGSWGGGVLASRVKSRNARTPLRLYAAAEAIIGLSGIVVAPLLRNGQTILMQYSGSTWGSGSYYIASGILITVALLPFCTCMGATFPLAIASVRSAYEDNSATSFSYLYVANVLGAMIGGLCAAFVLIELLGFHGTMLVAACLNLLVALLAFFVSRGAAFARVPTESQAPFLHASLPMPREWRFLLLLFMTGLVSLSMEVIWTRKFMPLLGPVVYTFAAILAIYLAATLLGSQIYRIWFRKNTELECDRVWQILVTLAAASALLPLVAADFRLPLPEGLFFNLVRVIIGIGPFCTLLGFITPAILDRISSGNPRRAGIAYALNTVGCIAGPLLAGFILLPWCGERWSLVLLTLPLFMFGIPAWRNGTPERKTAGSRIRIGIFAILGLSVVAVGSTKDFEHMFPGALVLRDHTATVIAGGEGLNRFLLVNGMGVTKLTPVTKMMVHLPLASLDTPPQKGLVLCLGMGTSFRSMLSWGIPSTVVELVPSIPSLLPFYQVDGDRLLTAPGGRIIIDDARRFLERSKESFSVVVVDPPPPIEAAASSLLYSREFYSAVVKRLAPDGILQQWIPWDADGFEDKKLLVAMTMALSENFPYVRAFRSLEGWGLHFLASKMPIPTKTPAQLAAMLPKKASEDIVEWGPFETPQEQFAKVLSQEVPLQEILDLSPRAPVLSDDRPLNEYYLLRKYSH